MALDLYSMGARVQYGDFIAAVAQLVRNVVARTGRPLKDGALSVDPSDAHTASVSVARDHQGNILEVLLRMPAIAPDTMVSGAYARRLLALLLHEIAHMAYSDVSALSDFMLRELSRGSKEGNRAAGLFNCAEDYFIERRACDPDAPLTGAAAELLGALNDALQSTAGELARKGVEAGDKLAQAEALILASLNRHGRQGRALQSVLVDVEAVVSPEVRAAVGTLLDELDRLDDNAMDPVKETAARGHAVTRMLDTLRGQQQGQGQGQKQQDGQQPKDGQQQGQGQGQSQGQQPQDGQQQDGQQQDGQQQGQGQQQDGQQGSGRSLPCKHPGDRNAQRAIAALGQLQPRQSMQQTVEAMHTMRHFASMPEPAKVKNAVVGMYSPYPQIALQMANARAFADAARRALTSPELVHTSRRLQSGRIDRRALTRASMGARDVMARRTMAEGVETAVVVMLDLSSSMNDRVSVGPHEMARVQATAGITAALVPAMERAGARVQLAGFSSHFEGSARSVVFKRWEQRMPDPAELLKQTELDRVHGTGGTPMVGPLIWAERELMAQRANRRVCIWLCDGQPTASEESVLKDLTRKRAGIEHVGIGLQCSMGALFPRSVRINDMAALARAFQKLLTEPAQEKGRAAA